MRPPHTYNYLRSITAIICICMVALPSSAQAAVYGYIPNSSANTVSVVDLDENEIIHTISNTGGTTPADIVIDGTGAYVVNNGNNTVTLIDLTTNTILETISISAAPQAAAISGTGVYVATTQFNRIGIIDVNTNTEVKTVSVGSTPLAIAAGGTGVFVSNNLSDNVSIIDVESNTVVGTVTVGNGPLGLAVSGTGVFVANYLDDTVSVIDTTTGGVDATISVGDAPYDIVINGTGAYVSNFNDETLSVIDTTTNTVERTINVSQAPYEMASYGTNVYVMHMDDDLVSVIDTGSNTVTDTITAGDQPRGMAFGPDLVTPEVSFQSDSLTVSETVGTITINLTLSGSAAFDISAPFTVAGTATSGSDYTLSSTSPVIINNGETSTGIVLTLINDGDVESDETIILTLGSPTNAGTGSTVIHTITVTSDDGAASSSSSAAAAGGGVREVTLDMKRQAALQRFGSVYYADSSSSSVASFFTDVPASSWFHSFVEKLRLKNIISGYKDAKGADTHMYGPGDPVSYGQLAKMILLLIRQPPSDMTAHIHWAEPYVRAARTRGLSTYLNEQLNLDAHATRGAVIRTILEAYGISLDALPQSTFLDLSSDHPYAKDMLTATALDIISGDEGGRTVRPDDMINRAELAKILIGVSEKFSPASTSASSSSSSSSGISSEPLKPAAGADIRTVRTPILNVRSDARIDAHVLWVARQGMTMYVLRVIADDWAHIRMSDGNEGYVWVHHLEQ